MTGSQARTRFHRLSACLVAAVSLAVVAPAAASEPAESWVVHGTPGYGRSPKVVVPSPDGTRVFVTGEGPTSAYATADGTELWSVSGPVYPKAMSVSADGARVFVTGAGFLPEYRTAFATVAYDAATGAVSWMHRDEDGAYDVATSIAMSPDGARVFVTGRSSGEDGRISAVTISLDAGTGTELWRTRYEAPLIECCRFPWREATSPVLAVSPDGSRAFVSGFGAGFVARAVAVHDYTTIALDTRDGTVVWVARHRQPLDRHAAVRATLGDRWPEGGAIGVTPDGSTVVVAGSTRALAYHAATGVELWAAEYPTRRHATLAVSPDGARVFVTGAIQQDPLGACLSVCEVWPEPASYLTTAYDARLGVPLWATTIGTDRIAPSGIAADPDGSEVYVMGTAYNDFVVAAFDALTGGRQWTARHPETGPDAHLPHTARAISIDATGSRLFVTGERTVAAEGETGYVTVAYCGDGCSGGPRS
jgi:outer membrane protein assembly factor BamB